MLYQGSGGQVPARGLWPGQRRELGATRLGLAHARLQPGLDTDPLDRFEDDELIELVTAFEQLAAWAAAGQLAAMAQFARRRRGADREFASDELAPAAALTPRTASARLDLAEDLANRLPTVLAAMTRGHLSLAKAAIIATHTHVLDDHTTRHVTDQLLDDAAHWTTGQLTHRLDKAIILADPAAAQRRAEHAKQERGVWLRRSKTNDGNAELGALLDAHDAAAAFALIDHTARAAHTPGDTRTIGQRRAAALTDLILNRTPHPTTTPIPEPRGTADEGPTAESPADEAPEPQTEPRAGATTIINLVVPLSLIEALLNPHASTDQPGWIERLGPLPGTTIRDLIRELLTGTRTTSNTRTGWRIIGCDTNGRPHALSHTTYRPPQALTELIQLRDTTCRFPGCRQQATRCDLDHAHPHEHGGPTCDCNLHTLCRHHHRLKQHPGWTLTLNHGTTIWTSPTGRTYTTTPPDDWAPDDWSPDG